MKKLFFILIIATTLFEACRGFDDGPKISFRSISSRLFKNWTVEQYLVDDIDSTKHYYDSCGCDILFDNQSDDDPQFHLINNCINDSKKSAGHFGITHKVFQIRYASYYSVIPFEMDSQWDIKRLTKDEFWLTSTQDGKKYFLKLKVKKK